MYFSNKIHGSNFIRQLSETVMVWSYQNADCSLKKINLLCHIVIFCTLSFPNAGGVMLWADGRGRAQTFLLLFLQQITDHGCVRLYVQKVIIIYSPNNTTACTCTIRFAGVLQCCCPWPWSLALRCPRGQILSPWPWPWRSSPWPRQVGQPVNLIFQGTSEPQKPWHAIACFIALIALSLFIAWTCATVELLILRFCVLSHP